MVLPRAQISLNLSNQISTVLSLMVLEIWRIIELVVKILKQLKKIDLVGKWNMLIGICFNIKNNGVDQASM